MNSHTNTLRQLIEASVLMKNERKESLLAALPLLDEPKTIALIELLNTEPAGIAVLCSHVVEGAVEHGEEEWLKDFDHFLQRSNTSLRTSSEEAERTDDYEHADRLLDDA